ncbi:hypothetical protein F511_18124 [Dorcoceras hygrometricum]|uniref:Transmembrane protein n=1 Tax=Dorcoceras hygrometricum TaxID=472368 RepID=A0A2Z7B9W5_9LAMI|nr:hypothetical protein F511_18124 [Dorcoceras hygrometricum]
MSMLKPLSRGNAGESVNKSCGFPRDHKLCTCNSSSHDFLHGNKLFLNHEHIGKRYSCNQTNVLESDATLLSARYVDENAEVTGENQLIEEYCTTFPKNSAAFCLDKPSKDCCSNAKSDEDSWLQELESIADESFERAPKSKGMEESWHSNAKLMYLDCERPEKNCSDLDSQWSELTKFEPWWHSADKDDVASFISRRSSSHIRNCDLPEPQAFHFEKGSDNGLNCFDQVKEQMANRKAKVLCVADCSQGNDAGLVACTAHGSDGTLSSGNLGAIKVDSSVTSRQESFDLNKTQLLEALCHSQTRAREAEKLAQDACDEKDHIIELFFRQASYLFAYKQWIRILQIETLCLQHGNKSLLPSVKNMVLGQDKHKIRKKKPGKGGCCICKCAFTFALGLSLAGAGLLVGWTIGWLFSAF